MADLEKIIHAQHPGSLPPKASLWGICPASAVCTRATNRATFMVRPTKRTKNNKPCADLDIAAAKLRPSKGTPRALQTAYEHFNRELFGGTLPRCLITLQGLNKRSFGHCLSRWNRDGRAIHEIGINPLHFAYDPMQETLATLVVSFLEAVTGLRNRVALTTATRQACELGRSHV